VAQLRLPKGEQKPQEVILEIVGYGVANALIATVLGISPIGRSSWPSDDVEVLKIFAAIFLLPERGKILEEVAYEKGRRS
jgi:hypothetical protein